jgi:hypothetical protein
MGRPPGRPRRKWKENMKMEFTEIEREDVK